MEKGSEIVNSYAKGFMFGALIGGLAGAVTALLFAPSSGAELRGNIKRRSSEAYDAAGEYVSEVGQEAKILVNQGKQKAEHLVSSAKEQVDSLLSSADKVLREAKYRTQTMGGDVQEVAVSLKDAAKAGIEAFRAEVKTVRDVDTELG